MQGSKNLRRPTNWQDFESLCKKLWGEIWNCPEIKKNGRNGQNQHGVDIYGIPHSEKEYFGIQCKGKDEYKNKQFTEVEIKDEIEKAKQFQPLLKKLYFATTSVKDVAIEEFIRKMNIENKSMSLFEIHIFSWEDIVDLIDENKHTYNWYLKSQNFKTRKSITVTFHNGKKELTLNPQFKKTITHYKQKIVTSNIDSYYSDPLNNFFNRNLISPFPSISSLTSKTNLSYCNVCFQIHNTGIDPIEEYKMFFEFEGEVQDIAETNSDNSMSLPSMYRPNISFSKNPLKGKVIPKKSILVGDDIFSSDSIFLKPFPKVYDIMVKWKIISKDFKDEGIIKLVINPQINRENIEILVEDPFKAGCIEEGDIEDVKT